MNDDWTEREYLGPPARLDRALVELFEDQKLTRSHAKVLIDSGAVLVDGKPASKAGLEILSGKLIAISEASRPQQTLLPSSRALEILYEDSDLIVINKPPGLTMHPGAGTRGDTLLNAVLGRLTKEEIASPERPGIVHRLDKDTSGVVVVAKTPSAHANLAKQFESKTAERRYCALVFTTPRGKNLVSKEDQGKISTFFGRHPTKRTLMSVLPKASRRAITNWQVLDRYKHGCLLELFLETGRTHQIRVHMAHIGSPVIGDRTYGDFSALPSDLKRVADTFGRQALHARTLTFDHPTAGRRISFESPIPDDMLRLIEDFNSYA